MGKELKTLYVSDLDGTLLRSCERTSEYTNSVINRLTEQGMIFSYATARSSVTAKKVTRGMDAKIPIIVYNGAFILDNDTGEIMLSNFLGEEIKSVVEELVAAKIYPIVYSYIDGKEKFSFVRGLINEATNQFAVSREGDIRYNCVDTPEELKRGEIFYLTCIDEPEKLLPFYEKYKEKYHCEYQKDIYSGEQWLEIIPAKASKANAIKQLKQYLKCDRVVVFGDGKNDIDMFELADESYAVENAHADLKKFATGIIGANDEDAVAHWLEENVKKTV